MNDSEILIFGGSYSNLEATTEIISIAKELLIPASRIFCTGDIVGYCANPEETVQLITNWGIHTIVGNVEINLRNGEEDCGCNFDEGSRCDTFSQRWYPYAKIHLSETSIDWMKQLPEIIRKEINGKKVVMIHGGIPNVSEFIFASTPWKRKQELFDLLDADVIFCGHSGLPFVQEKNDKLWINAGVIGMPANDGTSRAWFATLNPHTWKVKIHSFDYDNEQAANKMITADLPFEYAHTLKSGIWDNCEILPSQETKAQGIRIQEDYHWEK